MNNRIINDITNFIFVEDEPKKADAIFLPGGSHPEQPEYAAELYKQGFAPIIVTSGGVSVKKQNLTVQNQRRIFTIKIIKPTVSF